MAKIETRKFTCVDCKKTFEHRIIKKHITAQMLWRWNLKGFPVCKECEEKKDVWLGQISLENVSPKSVFWLESDGK